MTTDFKSIPIIDISSLVAKIDDHKTAEDPDVQQVVKQLDIACREAGFFYVRGHGIPESLLQEARSLARSFFHLPDAEKLKIKMTSATGYRGYQKIGENVTKGSPDMHEAIDCYKEIKLGMYGSLGEPMAGFNLWPLEPRGTKAIMEDYINACTDLSRKIMRGIALALSGSSDVLERSIASDPFWVLRIIGYPNLPSDECNISRIGCGAHTDYGLLTLVNQDNDITALQVRNVSGEWVDAPPVPGAFVCNIGDMLKIWSNGLYESTLHRVVNDASKYRVCVAYFYEPNYDAAVEPFHACMQKSGGVRKFNGAVYGEHLVGKVLTNFI